MKRNEAISLNLCLSHKDLKVKYLSGETYAKLIGLKRPLVRWLDEMGVDENTLMREMGIEDFSSKDKSFRDKLDVIWKVEFNPKELNFIPSDEFKKFTDEVDFNTGATLAEFLLKES